MDNVGFDTIVAFYRSNPREFKSRRTEENAFFATTMRCCYEDEYGTDFRKAVSDYYKECTDSGQSEVEHLMDAPYELHGTFFKRVTSLIRKMASKNVFVDAESMEKELNLWDIAKKNRKEDIAKMIIGIGEENE